MPAPKRAAGAGEAGKEICWLSGSPFVCDCRRQSVASALPFASRPPKTKTEPSVGCGAVAAWLKEAFTEALSTIWRVVESTPSEMSERAPVAVIPPTAMKAEEFTSATPLLRPVSGALGTAFDQAEVMQAVAPGCDE